MKFKDRVKKINLSKKQKIILAITIAILGVGGFSGYLSMSQIKKQRIEMENTFGIYTIAGKEKIFMSGKVEPVSVKKIFVNGENGELDKLIVANGKYVTKGTPLFTCKNKSQINEISSLNSQIAQKKKEKQNAVDEESKQSIEMQIKELNSQVSILNKTAYSTVYAPFAGNVYLNDKATEGDTTQPVLTLQTDDFYIKAQVNERDSYKIKLNQLVEVTALATKQNYNGKILNINNIPLEGENLNQGFSDENGMSQYGVDISLESQENLKSGLHVQLIALYGSEYRKIPSTAILKENDKTYVFKLEGSLVNKKEIKVVQEKDGYALVSSGIKENAQIIEDIVDRKILDGQEIIAIGNNIN